MKKIFIVSIVLLTLSAHAISQAKGNAPYNPTNNGFYNQTPTTNNNNNGYTNYNQNYVPGEVDLTLDNRHYDFSSNLLEANVMVNVPATAYVAIFSLTQNGGTIKEADSALDSRIKVFEKMLRSVNIEFNKVFIDPVSFIPTYEVEVENKKFSKTYNEVPSGFEIKKNVHIEFRDHKQINLLISAAAQAEIYDLVKVDYMVADMNKVLDGLREKALDILESKRSIIQKAGIDIRFKVVREKYGSVYPIERYAEYYAYKTGVTPSFASNYKKNIQQKVQYNYAEKNKTTYYDEVSDKQFDLVINPVVGEPQIQVYLTLKGQYEVYDEEKEAIQKEYDNKLRILQNLELDQRIQEKKKELAASSIKAPVKSK
jgi:hypothetical protein